VIHVLMLRELTRRSGGSGTSGRYWETAYSKLRESTLDKHNHCGEVHEFYALLDFCVKQGSRAEFIARNGPMIEEGAR